MTHPSLPPRHSRAAAPAPAGPARGARTRSAITVRALTFDWPDGSRALSDVSGTFPEGRTGLVGANGAGKSTLLRLIAGELTATSGQIEVAGAVGYLPQTLAHSSSATVAELLGIEDTLRALRAVESGDVSQAHFDTIGDDWDVEARAAEALDRIDLGRVGLDRRAAELSGGEAMLIALTGLRLRSSEVTLLDEPTNNLDQATRATLAGIIDDWPGTLVVVSHDVDLLERMQHTTELHAGSLTTFGGPYSAWQQHFEQQQAAAVQQARSAKQALQAEKRQRVDAETKLARRQRTAKKTATDGGIPKILQGRRASSAQESAGALRGTLDGRVDAAQRASDEADARVREDTHISITLPDPKLPAGKRIAEFSDARRSVIVQGPERVAIIGDNGAGKSTLLAGLVTGAPAMPGRAQARRSVERVGYLPQGLDSVDLGVSALANVQSVAPQTPAGTIRNQLARLLLRGDSADRPAATLSGGERLRVALAKLLLADPPAELIVLDEPTNNLDLTSIEQLVEALAAYRGALVVVSHDYAFLRKLEPHTVLWLSRDGSLTECRGVPETADSAR